MPDSAHASAPASAPGHVPALHSLRLNCWLAGLLPATVAALSGIAFWAMAESARQTGETAALRHTLAAWAEAPAPLPLVALARDPRWSGLARVRVVAERVVPVESVGQAPGFPAKDVPEGLILAALEPRSWSDAAGRQVVAVAERGADRSITFLVGWAPAPPTHGLGLLAATVAGCLGLGAILAFYLGRRIWRPIEALGREADAAMRDAPQVAVPPSEEVEAVASSIRSLATAYRDLHRSARQPPSTSSVPGRDP